MYKAVNLANPSLPFTDDHRKALSRRAVCRAFNDSSLSWPLTQVTSDQYLHALNGSWIYDYTLNLKSFKPNETSLWFAKLYARNSRSRKESKKNLCKPKYAANYFRFLDWTVSKRKPLSWPKESAPLFEKNYDKHKFILNVQFKFVKIDKNER